MRVVIPTLVSNYRIGDNFISFFFCLNWQLDAYSSDSTANHSAVFDYIEPVIVLGCEVMSVRDF